MEGAEQAAHEGPHLQRGDPTILQRHPHAPDRCRSSAAVLQAARLHFTKPCRPLLCVSRSS